MAESLIGLYKLECVRHEGRGRGVDDLELATLNWVHWFNTHRLHSSLGHVPPAEFETNHYRQINSQPQPRPGRTRPSLNRGRFSQRGGRAGHGFRRDVDHDGALHECDDLRLGVPGGLNTGDVGIRLGHERFTLNLACSGGLPCASGTSPASGNSYGVITGVIRRMG